jgi:hypothetical protein
VQEVLETYSDGHLIFHDSHYKQKGDMQSGASLTIENIESTKIRDNPL